MGAYANSDLTFDGPRPSDPGWPMKLKVAMAAVVVSMAAWVGAVVGSWLFNQYEPNVIEANYGPVAFVSPAPITDGLGNEPTVEGLPEPAVDISAGDTIPVSLTRAFDCAYFECAEGSIPVLVDIRFVQLDVTGQETFSFIYLEDYETTYEEDSDYVRDTTTIITNTLSPFDPPQQMIDHLMSEDSNFSAWRIEGTSTIDRPDAIPASWRSEVFHVTLGLED